MASGLYFGTDDRIISRLQKFFEERRVQAGEVHSITRIDTEPKLNEILVGMAFDLIFCEQNSLSTIPQEWIKAFRRSRPGIRAPLILVGDETDQMKVFRYLESGWVDYLFLPPDLPLLIEKFYFYSTGERSRDVRQVYSMTMSQPADMAKNGTLEELSEVDCKIRSLESFSIGTLITIYAKAFGEESQKPNPMTARCYGSIEHPEEKGYFLNSFYFVGVDAEPLATIRNSLRKQFVSKKAT